HRRLRPRPADEERRADPAGAHRSGAQPASLSPYRRHQAHGGALGLRPARLLAAAPGRDDRRPRVNLCGAAAPRAGRSWPGPRPGGDRLGPDDAGVSPDAAVLSAVALLGPRPAGRGARLYGVYPRFRLSTRQRARRIVEGARARERIGAAMTRAAEL